MQTWASELGIRNWELGIGRRNRRRRGRIANKVLQVEPGGSSIVPNVLTDGFSAVLRRSDGSGQAHSTKREKKASEAGSSRYLLTQLFQSAEVNNTTVVLTFT